MLDISHPLADTLKPLLKLSELGAKVNANSKSYWPRNTGNMTIEEGCKVWKHTYKVKMVYI